ncbi:MAG TPA: hypothetical protein VFR85_16775 [Anaeromyxobacteraceae bacterium]|nr:hypothetical protein [Anaeromyxobacteraceae bacterium]
MYRALALAMVVLVAVGCGGGDNPPPPPQCPASQAPVGTIAGTLGGIAFAPSEMGALLAGPATCTVGTVSVRVAAVIVGLTSFQGLCSLAQQYGFCFDKANATLASLQLANLGLVQAQTLPGPGTYPVTIGTPTPDLNGNFQVYAATYAREGAACALLASSDTTALPASGSITLTTVNSTSVSGSVSLTFTDGSTLSGTFTAPTAPISMNVCQLVSGCTSVTCVP